MNPNVFIGRMEKKAKTTDIMGIFGYCRWEYIFGNKNIAKSKHQLQPEAQKRLF